MKYHLPKALTYNLIDPAYPAANLANLKAALVAGISAEPEEVPGVSAAGPLIRWFEYSHGNVGGGKAWATTQANALAPGRPSPFFEALTNALQDGAVLVRGTGGPESMAHVEGVVDVEWQEPGRQVLVVLAGGDVEDVPVFFELDDIDVVCPFGDGVETWATWGVSVGNAPAQEIGGKWYRASYSGPTGTPLRASVWVPFYLAGNPVLSVSQFVAIQQGG